MEDEDFDTFQQDQSDTEEHQPRQQKNQQPGQQEQEGKPLQKALRILTIDGGGIRGIAVARILEGIEEDTGKRIHELFDVVVGTSTGGLLSVMMCVELPDLPTDVIEGTTEEEKELVKQRTRQRKIREVLDVKEKVLTAKQAKELYLNKARKIFHEEHNWWHQLTDRFSIMSKMNHFWRSKYKRGDGLIQIVQDLYLENDFSHAKTCVGVIVTERGYGCSVILHSTNAKIKEKHNYHNHLTLPEVVRATSAAPTYFDPIIVKNPVHHQCESQSEKLSLPIICEKHSQEAKFCQRKMLFFEDGGVTCNNPSVKAFEYAKKLLRLHELNPSEYQFQVYSIGTGSIRPEQTDPVLEHCNNLEISEEARSGNLHALVRLVSSDPFQIERNAYSNHLKMKRIMSHLENETGIEQIYHRLQFKVSPGALQELDKCDRPHMDELIQAGTQCVETNPVYQDMIKSLNFKVERPKDLVKLNPGPKKEI